MFQHAPATEERLCGEYNKVTHRNEKMEGQATIAKYQSQWEHVRNMRVRDKRQLFYILRTVQNISPNTFFPVYGLTAGEFAVWQILTEYTKKSQ